MSYWELVDLKFGGFKKCNFFKSTNSQYDIFWILRPNSKFQIQNLFLFLLHPHSNQLVTNLEVAFLWLPWFPFKIYGGLKTWSQKRGKKTGNSSQMRPQYMEARKSTKLSYPLKSRNTGVWLGEVARILTQLCGTSNEIATGINAYKGKEVQKQLSWSA